MATRTVTRSKTKPRTQTKKAPAKKAPVRRRTRSRGLSGDSTDAVQAKWLDRALIGAVGIGILGGGYLMVKKTYNAIVVEPKRLQQVNMSQTFGTPAYFASQLDLAFHPSGSKNIDDWFGDGTDEEKVLEVLKLIPSKAAFEQTITSYRQQYSGRNLSEDLKAEMTSFWGNGDYDKVIKILQTYK